jgi:hypothetical protein
MSRFAETSYPNGRPIMVNLDLVKIIEPSPSKPDEEFHLHFIDGSTVNVQKVSFAPYIGMLRGNPTGA